jgi:hypothetical protein
MAPPNTQKRVKGVSVFRPFVYGTTAKPFDPVTNPKPEGVPADHTHSWTVFVKGVEDTDITYWCKKVQFKLHESIPNPIRSTYAAAARPLLFLFPVPPAALVALHFFALLSQPFLTATVHTHSNRERRARRPI